MRPERFELPTYSSGGCRSIQLSYGRTPLSPVYMRSFSLSIIESTIGVKLWAMIAEPMIAELMIARQRSPNHATELKFNL